MTSTVADHYEQHLAPIYSWMVGDFEIACQKNSNFFDELDIPTKGIGRAVDLGCGHGLQTVALAQRGFQVISIDNSRILLDELDRRASGLPVTPIHDDIINFSKHVTGSVDLVVCMGDTLTHLREPADVSSVIGMSAKLLRAGGSLLVSFRDYSSTELEGLDRFIPVRADETRIHTCFLEYAENVVNVHDIIQSRSSSGWHTEIGSYPKLRISPDNVIGTAANFKLENWHHSVREGMVYLAFGSDPKQLGYQDPDGNR